MSRKGMLLVTGLIMSLGAISANAQAPRQGDAPAAARQAGPGANRRYGRRDIRSDRRQLYAGRRDMRRDYRRMQWDRRHGYGPRYRRDRRDFRRDGRQMRGERRDFRRDMRRSHRHGRTV